MNRAKRLIAAAKEAAAIARGEAKPAATHAIPQVDVKAVRLKLGLSQAAFAGRFGLGVASVRDYEQNRRKPDRAIRAYLRVIERDPEAVERALADW